MKVYYASSIGNILKKWVLPSKISVKPIFYFSIMNLTKDEVMLRTKSEKFKSIKNC
jgi:hypothetical protein